jgi:2-amino-4-hydroxy-6-hydroxymethyldihydropteridine diphosphokinase
VRYWVGLGANVGHCETTLRRAAHELEGLGVILRRSQIYATEPVGGPPQPPFHNAAVLLETEHDPPQLLGRAQAIEAALGRDRSREVRWGPRTIDIDLLLAGNEGELIVHLPGLELPHPRLHERAFALAPVVEISPELVHPTQHRPLAALLRERLAGEAVAPTGERL